jgi:predicted Zn-dependent protease
LIFTVPLSESVLMAWPMTALSSRLVPASSGLDVVKVQAEQSLIEYLNSGRIENIENGSVEELTISGVPAATATAIGTQFVFRLYVVRFGGEVYRFIFSAKNRTPEARVP